VALHYTNWQDAWDYMDPDIFGPPDIERMEQYLADAEAAFDAELSIRFDVPFTLALHPDSYGIAKQVCGRRGAAEYIRWQGGRQGGTDSPRRAVELDRDADVWMARLKTPLVPADAPDADSPQVMLPTDGGGVVRSTAAFFTRGHVTPKTSTHW
jgi:hypothetical protein